MKQPPTRRARNEDSKAERRAHILKSALNQFFNNGFTGTRIDDIAREAGLSKGTLYLYFSSKEVLFEALIQEIAIPHIKNFEIQLKPDMPIMTILDNFFTIAPVILRTTPVPKLIKILISDAQNFPDMVNLYREQVIKRILNLIKKLLQNASQRGEIVIDDAELTARLVIAPIVLSLIWIVVFEEGDDKKLSIESLLNQHKKMLLSGLKLNEH